MVVLRAPGGLAAGPGTAVRDRGYDRGCDPPASTPPKAPLMAPRSSWKGFLRLSLVSVPVKAFTANNTAEYPVIFTL